MEIGTLRAQNLYKSYGSKQVLTDLNLELEPGVIYGLLGRNGAGKTTLLSILTAQNTWDKGSVTYGGQPVWENQAALDHLCFSREFTSTLVTERMTLRVKYYLQAASIFYPHWDQDYAQHLLELFQLDPRQKLSQLSKGEASMVTILLALCLLAEDLRDGTPRVQNAYARAVPEQGNPRAQELLHTVFEPRDALWRGLGSIPESGLGLAPDFADMDALARLGISLHETPPLPGCRCGEVLKGRIEPRDCPLFARVCTPLDPVGPCMVSTEGSCAAYYKYSL